MNIKKTAGVLTQPTIKLKSFQFNISLCNEQIPLVKSYKYLGIHLNQGCANCGPRPEIVRPAKGCTLRFFTSSLLFPPKPKAFEFGLE